MDQFEDAIEDKAWTDQLDRMYTKEKKFSGGSLRSTTSSTAKPPSNHSIVFNEKIEEQHRTQPSSVIDKISLSSMNTKKDKDNVSERLDLSNIRSDTASSAISEHSFDSPKTSSDTSQRLLHISLKAEPSSDTKGSSQINSYVLDKHNKSDRSSSMPIKVNKNDVLCGRGKGSNNHPGNRIFRELVAQHRIYYLIAKTRETKTRACIDIINKLSSMTPPGRFLYSSVINNRKRWELLDERKAVMKTAQAFREGVTRRMLESFVENNIEDLVRHRRRLIEKATCSQKASTSYNQETFNQNQKDPKKKHPLKRRLLQRMKNESFD